VRDLDEILSDIARLSARQADRESEAIAALRAEIDALPAQHHGPGAPAAIAMKRRDIERRIGVHDKRLDVLLRRAAVAVGDDDHEPAFPAGRDEGNDPAFMQRFGPHWATAAKDLRLRVPGPLPHEGEGEGPGAAESEA
jgi:hypothetical protein